MAGLNVKKANRFRTICEVHREMFDILFEMEDVDKLLELLEEAFEIGKIIFWKSVKYDTEMEIEEFRHKGLLLPYLAKHYANNDNHDESVRIRRDRK